MNCLITDCWPPQLSLLHLFPCCHYVVIDVESNKGRETRHHINGIFTRWDEQVVKHLSVSKWWSIIGKQTFSSIMFSQNVFLHSNTRMFSPISLNEQSFSYNINILQTFAYFVEGRYKEVFLGPYSCNKFHEPLSIIFLDLHLWELRDLIQIQNPDPQHVNINAG